jgi:hypothetical protein
MGSARIASHPIAPGIRRISQKAKDNLPRTRICVTASRLNQAL